MHRNSLIGIIVLSLGLAVACMPEKKKDDQLSRFLRNDSVELRFTADVFSDSQILLHGTALDYRLKRTFFYPGVIYLDQKFISLTRRGSSFMPNIDRKSPFQEGEHNLKILFANDMDFDWENENWGDRKVDSFVMNFNVAYVDFIKPFQFTEDSLIIKTENVLTCDTVTFDFCPINNDGTAVFTGKRPPIKVAVKAGRIAIPTAAFENDEFTNYFANVFFSKETPLYYKGRKKGTFRYTYAPKVIRVKLKKD